MLSFNVARFLQVASLAGLMMAGLTACSTIPVSTGPTSLGANDSCSTLSPIEDCLDLNGLLPNKTVPNLATYG